MADTEDDIRRLMEVGDLVSPMALRVVVTLGLPSLIERNVHALEDLACATDTHPRVLRKILLHLVARGIFTRVGEDGFGLTSAGAQLLDKGSRAPLATSWDMTHVLGRVDLSTTRLLDVARTGRTSFAECFDRSLWQDLYDSATTAGGTGLDALDATTCMVEEDLIIDALDWSHITTFVDLGGGSVLAAAERADDGVVKSVGVVCDDYRVIF